MHTRRQKRKKQILISKSTTSLTLTPKGPPPAVILLFMLMLLSMGTVISFLVLRTTNLTCDRVNGQANCSLTEITLFSFDNREINIKSLTGAEIDKRTGTRQGHSSTVYGVILKTADGQYPLTRVYSSGYDSKRELVDEINSFLASPDPTFDLQIDPSFFGYLGPLMILLAFFMPILAMKEFRKPDSLVIDRARGILHYRLKEAFPKTARIRLSDISTIETVTEEKTWAIRLTALKNQNSVLSKMAVSAIEKLGSPQLNSTPKIDGILISLRTGEEFLLFSWGSYIFTPPLTEICQAMNTFLQSNSPLHRFG